MGNLQGMPADEDRLDEIMKGFGPFFVYELKKRLGGLLADVNRRLTDGRKGNSAERGGSNIIVADDHHLFGN